MITKKQPVNETPTPYRRAAVGPFKRQRESESEGVSIIKVASLMLKSEVKL